MTEKTFITFVNIFEYDNVNTLNSYLDTLDSRFVSFIQFKEDKYNTVFFNVEDFKDSSYRLIDYNKDKFQLYGKIYDLEFLRLFDLKFDSLTEGFDTAFILKTALILDTNEILYCGNTPWRHNITSLKLKEDKKIDTIEFYKNLISVLCYNETYISSNINKDLILNILVLLLLHIDISIDKVTFIKLLNIFIQKNRNVIIENYQKLDELFHEYNIDASALNILGGIDEHIDK